jgi:hypothetical protein
MFGLLIAIAILVPAALILAGHWFPWPSVLGRTLTRLEAYVFGVAVIYVMPLALFAYTADKGELALLFVASCISAGLATFAAWGVDLLVERYHKLQDAQDAAEHADE